MDDKQVKIWKKIVLAFSRYPNKTEGNWRRLRKSHESQYRKHVSTFIHSEYKFTSLPL